MFCPLFRQKFPRTENFGEKSQIFEQAQIMTEKQKTTAVYLNKHFDVYILSYNTLRVLKLF